MAFIIVVFIIISEIIRFILHMIVQRAERVKRLPLKSMYMVVFLVSTVYIPRFRAVRNRLYVAVHLVRLLQ